jgi:hypothetical protein
MPDRTIASLCQRSHEMSRSKGWYNGEEKDQRPIRLITLLMQSELIEALEEWRSNKRLDEVYFSAVHNNGATTMTYEQYVAALAEAEQHPAASAEDIIRDFKPEGIGIEAADMVIRAAQRCGSEGFDLQAAVADFRQRLSGKFTADFEEMLATEMANLSMAYLVTTPYGASLFKEVLGVEPLTWVSLAVAGVWDFCDQIGTDLWTCIELKERFNATRPHRHGNKKA